MAQNPHTDTSNTTPSDASSDIPTAIPLNTKSSYSCSFIKKSKQTTSSTSNKSIVNYPNDIQSFKLKCKGPSLATHSYSFSRVYNERRECLVDDSILAFLLFKHICEKKVSISLCSPSGSGNTFFTQLIQELPQYKDLEIFTNPSEDLYRKLFLHQWQLKEMEKKPFLDKDKVVTEEKVHKLYSETLIINLDLRLQFTNFLNEKIYKDNLEAYFIYVLNKKIVQAILPYTTQCQGYENKLNNFLSANQNIMDLMKQPGYYKSREIRKDVEELYNEIIVEIHEQIESLKLTKKAVKEDNGLKKTKSIAKDGDQLNSNVKTLVVILDHIDTLVTDDEKTITPKELKANLNSFISNTFFKEHEFKSVYKSPINIQFIFNSILPLNVKNNTSENPQLQTFTKFINNSLVSYGEFTTEHLYNLLFEYECSDNPNNLKLLVDHLIRNDKEIIPFVQCSMDTKDTYIAEKIWENSMVETLQEMSKESETFNDPEREMVKRALFIFFIHLFGQPVTHLIKDNKKIELRLQCVFDLNEKMNVSIKEYNELIKQAEQTHIQINNLVKRLKLTNGDINDELKKLNQHLEDKKVK